MVVSMMLEISKIMQNLSKATMVSGVISRGRQNNILARMQREGSVSVRDLARQFDVSESTIRRDLELLDRNGELTRTHGGAVLLPRATVSTKSDPERQERPFGAAGSAEESQKAAVAAEAARLVADDAVILLDIGTTTPYLARELHGRPVTVITSNLAVFDELREDEAIRLVLLGGVVRRNYRSLVGSLTQQALRELSADIAFLSCTGVRPDGRVVDNMAVEAPVKQAMMAASGSVVLLAPEAKFPGTGAMRICDLAEIDIVVTTSGADEKTLEYCRQAGGEVIFV
jgi:DeoR/GlpR family transcriptional regulator of sugar metabolism